MCAGGFESEEGRDGGDELASAFDERPVTAPLEDDEAGLRQAPLEFLPRSTGTIRSSRP